MKKNKDFIGVQPVSRFSVGEYLIKANSKSLSPVVYVRGEYDRSLRKYELTRFDDISRSIYVSGDTLFSNDFIF